MKRPNAPHLEPSSLLSSLPLLPAPTRTNYSYLQPARQPAGEYSDVAGLKDENDCKECPTGYRGWQCSWEIKAQNYDKTKVHAYDKDEYTTNNAEHPQGLSPVSFYDMTKPLVNCQGDDDVSLDNPRCAT